jgi:hypothetical protein
MAGVAGLKRLAPAALQQAKAMRDADVYENVGDALKTATEKRTRLRDPETAGAASGPWITPWALAERTLGVNRPNRGGYSGSSKHAASCAAGRSGTPGSELSRNSSLRAMQPAAKPPAMAPIRNFDLAWIRPNFSHRRWVGSTKKAQAQCAAWGVPLGGAHARASVGLRRFSLVLLSQKSV